MFFSYQILYISCSGMKPRFSDVFLKYPVILPLFLDYCKMLNENFSHKKFKIFQNLIFFWQIIRKIPVIKKIPV